MAHRNHLDISDSSRPRDRGSNNEQREEMEGPHEAVPESLGHGLRMHLSLLYVVANSHDCSSDQVHGQDYLNRGLATLEPVAERGREPAEGSLSIGSRPSTRCRRRLEAFLCGINI